MNRILFILFLTLSLSSFSQTQAEMNKASYAEFNEADKQLNKIYKIILSEYKTDELFLENLKKSQRLWIQFRDAELEMKYPNYPENVYGSIHPTCRSFYLKDLTNKRIQTLKKWVGKTEEGELCSGSIKMLDSIDSEYMERAYISKDGSIRIAANMKKDHRIFGYSERDINSTKMILLSIFTNEVEFNPFDCIYGAYYDTSGMKNIKLKYLQTENDYLKVEIIKDSEAIDYVFMLKKWFEFE